MKIYLTGSVSNATPEIRENYKLIKKALEDLGYSVFADHVIDKTKEDISKQGEEKNLQIQRVMAKRKIQSDLVIAETSVPSFGVGEEIAYSLNNNKQVLALHLPGQEPHLIKNDNNDLLYIVEYTRKTLKDVLKDYIELSKDQMDVRFNFFVSPKIINYLDFISKNRKMPRAVYLRRLIEKDMKKMKDFK